MSSSCNTTRNEKGGKDLLLKVCAEVEAAINSTSDVNDVTITAHGLSVNDLVRFGVDDIGAMTGVTEGTFYYVKTVESANVVQLSASPGGSVIAFSGTFAGTVEVFKTVGGLRNASISVNAEMIDVSNYGSNQWRELLSGAGLKSVAVAGDGVYNSATNYRAIESSLLAQTLVCLAFVEIVTGRIYSGCFKIVSLEAAAEYSGEATFSASFESSGEVAIAQAA